MVLEYAMLMTATPVDVPDELFVELRRRFSEAQLVELTAAIAWENYRARFDHAFGIESQGFSEGAYCALPERPRNAVAQTPRARHGKQPTLPPVESHRGYNANQAVWGRSSPW